MMAWSVVVWKQFSLKQYKKKDCNKAIKSRVRMLYFLQKEKDYIILNPK